MTDKPEKKQHKAALKALELREKELDVAKAAVDLESAELSLDGRRFDRVFTAQRHGPLLDADQGIFRMETSVFGEVLGLGAAMERWGAANPGKDITLYLFSPGGSVLHGFALYDTLRTLSRGGHKVITVIRGYAGSMASVIFLAGDERRIGAESIIHQHEVSTMTGGRASEVSEDAKFTQRLGDKIARIYADRTNMTVRQFKAKTVKKEWHAEAPEALELGLATVIE